MNEENHQLYETRNGETESERIGACVTLVSYLTGSIDWSLLLFDGYLRQVTDDDFRPTLIGFNKTGNTYPSAPVGRLRSTSELVSVTSPYDRCENLVGMGAVEIEKSRLPHVPFCKNRRGYNPAYGGSLTHELTGARRGNGVLLSKGRETSEKG